MELINPIITFWTTHTWDAMLLLLVKGIIFLLTFYLIGYYFGLGFHKSSPCISVSDEGGRLKTTVFLTPVTSEKVKKLLLKKLFQ